jgi:hypothetical protein
MKIQERRLDVIDAIQIFIGEFGRLSQVLEDHANLCI